MVKYGNSRVLKDIIDEMSGNDPDWRPGGRAVRGRGRNGGGHLGQVPNVEALEAEAEDHIVWIRGRVVKQETGAWQRTEGRIVKRIYPG